jgi:ubiquinone/menaquinone biosynthesis C-methylase UbiE
VAEADDPLDREIMTSGTHRGLSKLWVNDDAHSNRSLFAFRSFLRLEMFVIVDLKRCILASTLVAAFVVAGAHDSFSPHLAVLQGAPVQAVFAQIAAPDSRTPPLYETRANHDPDGSGKFYMGREIAQVMGPGGIEWLDRREREEEEHPAEVLDSLELRPGEVVADLGAGSGYFTFRIAPRVGETGKVIAVEIQEAMLNTLRTRATVMKAANVEVVQGTEFDPHLPVSGVDLVLFVDVYHELAYPFEVMTKVREALKPGGRVVFVEYRKEDAAVRIKEVHKMTVRQLEKEMRAVGLVRVRTVETLPLQHIVIFEKRD